MSSEWPILKIEEIAERVGMGPFGSSIKVETFVESGIPIISGEHLHDITLTEKKFRFITEQHATQLVKSNVFRGDVVFTHAGTIGQVSVIPKDSKYVKYILSQRQFFMRCNRELVNPLYVAYFFKSPQGRHKLLANASQVGVPSIARPVTYLRSIEIPVPPLAIQNQIVSVIESMRDRITLLRETNATLEAIAQALFKSWFVDFDPVRAKSEGKLPEGMDEATASLFPDNFEQSELGEIPKGWYYGKIGDVATVKSGFAFKGQSFSDSGLPVIKIKNILGDGTVDLQNIQYIKSNIANVNKKFSLNDGDIIIAMTGATIGKTGIVVKDELTPYLNQRVAKFDKKLDGPNNGWFIYTAFQNKNISEQVLNIAYGSAQQNISTSGIESIRLIIPKDLTIIDIFNTFSYSLFENWILNHKKITTLSKIFDNLLPRLISGQIRLSDEEEINSKIKVDA